jgi:predicted metal-dependent peptidase
MGLTPEDKIMKAKVRLGKELPFFYYLLTYVDIIKTDKVPTMGITDKELFYNPDFVDALTDENTKACLTHEILHNALCSKLRCGTRDKHLWNWATDIIINNMLINEKLDFPRSVMVKKHKMELLVPKDNKLEINQLGMTLTDIDKLTAEEIYEMLYKKCPKQEVEVICFGEEGDGEEGEEGKGKIKVYTFDKHEQGEGKTSAEREADEKEWTKRLVEASIIAKRIGKLPAGMKRYIGSLINNKVNWKRLLNKYLTNEQFSDFTWKKPSHRSQSCGVYLPSHVKENVKVAVAIDTSGSIGQEELTSFVSEIVHIIKSTNNLKAVVMQCDCKLGEELEVRNGDIPKILAMKIKGGGGTSHVEVFNHMLKEHKDIKVLICLTDGFTEFGDKTKYPFDVVWVLTKNSCEDKAIPFGKIIRMED